MIASTTELQIDKTIRQQARCTRIDLCRTSAFQNGYGKVAVVRTYVLFTAKYLSLFFSCRVEFES